MLKKGKMYKACKREKEKSVWMEEDYSKTITVWWLNDVYDKLNEITICCWWLVGHQLRNINGKR